MPSRERTTTAGVTLAAGALAALVGVCVLTPVAYAAYAWFAGASQGAPAPPPAAGVPVLVPPSTLLVALERTFIAGGVIALFATLLAIPAAWVIREASPAGARRVSLCVGVLMLPNYLAYAGFNLLRAPMTSLAGWLADHPPWVSVLAGHVIALLGLALWAWPAAAIVLGLSLRRIGQDQLDALALSGAGTLARWRVLARAMLPGLAAAFAVVFILMLGSPVPLHVAQLDTYGVALWRRLMQTGDPVTTWISAWPLVTVALVLSALLVRALSRRLASSADPAPSPRAASRSRTARVSLWLVLAVSLVIPLLLHARATANPGKPFSFGAMFHMAHRFWHESSPALAASAGTGALCALVAVFIALATWAGLACPARRDRSLVRTVTLTSLAILLTAAITPGAVLGSATAAAWTAIAPLRALADTPLPVVCVHTARFGALAALLGAWGALLEPPALRDLRDLDAPGSLAAFFRACVRAHWTLPVAAAVSGFVLSLHEIESTVFVQPPGSGALAQQLLDALHFSRDDRLGVACLTLALASLALSYIGAWLMTRPARPPRPAGP